MVYGEVSHYFEIESVPYTWYELMGGCLCNSPPPVISNTHNMGVFSVPSIDLVYVEG